jgi:hypothetical protein
MRTLLTLIKFSTPKNFSVLILFKGLNENLNFGILIHKNIYIYFHLKLYVTKFQEMTILTFLMSQFVIGILKSNKNKILLKN